MDLCPTRFHLLISLSLIHILILLSSNTVFMENDGSMESLLKLCVSILDLCLMKDYTIIKKWFKLSATWSDYGHTLQK